MKGAKGNKGGKNRGGGGGGGFGGGGRGGFGSGQNQDQANKDLDRKIGKIVTSSCADKYRENTNSVIMKDAFTTCGFQSQVVNTNYSGFKSGQQPTLLNPTENYKSKSTKSDYLLF